MFKIYEYKDGRVSEFGIANEDPLVIAEILIDTFSETKVTKQQIFVYNIEELQAIFIRKVSAENRKFSFTPNGNEFRFDKFRYKGRFGHGFDLFDLSNEKHVRFNTSKLWEDIDDSGDVQASVLRGCSWCELHSLEGRKWNGPQALSRKIMGKISSSDEVNLAGNKAMYGGRRSVFKVGKNEDYVFSYDISNSYANLMAVAPDVSEITNSKNSFECKTSKKAIKFLHRYPPETIVDVFVEFGKESWYPLPYRERDQSISYPPVVKGSYFIFELVRAFEKWDVLKFCCSYIAIPKFTGEVKFPEISEYLDEIESLDRGSFERKALKVALNACWGIAAQQRYRWDTFGEWEFLNPSAPGWTASHWQAAFVTAKIRVILTKMMALAGNNLINCDTDGIMTTKRIKNFTNRMYRTGLYIRNDLVKTGTLFLKNGWIFGKDLVKTIGFRDVNEDNLNLVINGWVENKDEVIIVDKEYVCPVEDKLSDKNWNAIGKIVNQNVKVPLCRGFCIRNGIGNLLDLKSLSRELMRTKRKSDIRKNTRELLL